MKKICLILCFCIVDSNLLTASASKGTYAFTIENRKSPFYNKKVYKHQDPNYYYIPGYTSKVPIYKKYTKGNLPFIHVNDITFDTTEDCPERFKKLFWFRSPFRQIKNGKIDRNAYCEEIKNLIDQGYSVCCREKSILEWRSKTLRDPYCLNDPILHPPQAQKAVRVLYQITQNAYNPFEVALLCSVRIQDAYAYSFGLQQARKAYPNKNFRHQDHKGEAAIKFRKLGCNRLKKYLGDDYRYIVAGDEPTDDPLFGSIDEATYLQEDQPQPLKSQFMRYNIFLVIIGLVTIVWLCVSVYYSMRKPKTSKKQKKKSLSQKLKKKTTPFIV